MNKQVRFLPKILAMSVLAACAMPAFAQSAGSNIVGIGWFHLTPNDSSDGLTSPRGYDANAHSAVSNADTVGLSFTRFFTDNIALTADVGIPPTFNLNGTGTLAAYGQIGSAKQWSPALVMKYYFGEATSKFRPFLGAGVSYIWYSGVSLNSTFQNVAAGGSGTADASLSNSWAPVLNAGATYNFDDKWSLNVSVSYIPLKTDAVITAHPSAAPSVSLISKTSIAINPLVTFLSVGYKF
ncbi:OmpW family outer membrane protein [Herbaspirillum sp. RTI4]|uniref:OmpW/AlkL family protein n=1 Tax=Herbaspirillum sp. RTI4 TaxID=3048640 RepID=UPI002AB431D3|nr:OmpW family outer membrane protein [Herbaspirillum sp. RTI4]MDY7576791.1 OmpW family outer membrane protein [Herbaspirillum sp. RTI4]MEA9981387.1 OmpW family outer membrane protein [Herbaspirillum sp. RTI4]